ncbi:MAG TPA: alpha/beta hydrolase [Nevskiaceae bacterium]|nr:alpha/beta hydrolase [Nevskiaceae bacterium]
MGDVSFQFWRDNGDAFTYRGHRIFYALGGRGGADAALVLIHGFPTASWDWHRQWDALCKRFAMVVAPDMIGFGWSAKPRRYDYSILDQADLHEGLLRELGITDYHVLAHDYGDTVAQELLARRVERKADSRAPMLHSVCFLNGGLFPETHRPRLVQKLLASPLGWLIAKRMSEASFRKSFSAVFGPNTQPSAKELDEFWQLIRHDNGSHNFHKLIGYMGERRKHRARWVGALQSSPIPLRVVDGLVDPVSGAHMVARYRELVPNPDVVELPGIGHYPQVEAPDAVLRAFLEFHRLN